MTGHDSQSFDAPTAPILVVNDDRVQLEILTAILSKAGIPCDGQGSAEAALEHMAANPTPSMIVTDLHMPGIDGWRFCRLLRSREYEAFNHLPILVISATFAGEDTREITAATGADAFLSSPVQPEVFVDTVRGLMAGEARGQHRARALIVDDSPTFVGVLSGAFALRGYEVFPATTTQEARDAFSKTNPEIVVLDYYLPDGNGEELLDEFSKAENFSVVIMVTTDPSPELALRWMRMGAAAYARKPFEPEYLLSLCESAARERVMLRVEEMLEHKTQCLLQAQKMEAVGQLAGGVAHDFNNLLQVMHGYTDMVLCNLGDAHPASADLREVLRAAERAGKLVSQLLAFSRRQSMRRESLDLSAVIGEQLALIHRVIGEHISVHLTPCSGLPLVHADPQQIEQIMMNLCVNARDAMPKGGDLRIFLRRCEFDVEYCRDHRWASPGDYVCIEVSDTGCGMTPEVLDRVFEPFFTTKEMGKGTGLGLSSTYGIVKQNNGFIHVYSEPGQGSTFRVYFPVHSSTDAAPPASAPKDSGDFPGGSELILLAEDEEQVRKISERYLTDAGYQVVTAQDGGEALAKIFELGDALDLLVLDVMMPGAGGKDVLDQVRAKGFHTPALFVSGFSAESLSEDQLPSGVRLLQKPCSRRELLLAVRSMLENAAP